MCDLRQMRTESYEVNDAMFGGNASAEGGGDEGGDASSTSGVDVVMNGRLQEYALDKKTYMTHIKEYMKRWVLVGFVWKVESLLLKMVLVIFSSSW